MDAARYQQVTDLFTRARGVAPESREAFLNDVCGGDEELRQLVREFLSHDASLPDPPPIVLSQPAAPGLEPGDLVRNYRVQRLLGDGGMGLVYLADQLEPVRRTVALKIMKAGLDTSSLLKRFDLERNVLALMDHPNIARVYDAGATEAGRSYFVMEYVAGSPITTYCDRNRLSIHARLELFIQVCQAIQHAHQKGIIHRDIKPSNVMVTEVDGRPVPKVIDFGIARALEQTGEGETIYTLPGVMLGTPEYMSPEQALGREAPDTRADVYSLGVILYELLVGRRPIERDDLSGRTLDSLKRAIVDSDPRRPSTRIRDLGPDAVLPADNRSIDAPRLERLLRADLDWIVMRAIEKDRTRRYPSASELAADVERYLAGEPVVARPPTLGYRVGKYVRRHRYLVIGTSAVVLALVAGLGATAWQARVARQRLERIQEVSRVLVSRFYDLADQVGGMQTKESLAQMAVVTLDDLARKRNLSRQEKRDLADAFEALAQIQGDPHSSSIGLVAEARVSILRALQIRKEVFAGDTTNVAFATELIKCEFMAAVLHQGHPDVDPLVTLHHALAISDHLLTSQQRAEVMALASMCDLLCAEEEYVRGRTVQTTEHLSHATNLREQLVAMDPRNLEYRRLLAGIYTTVAYVTDDPDESLRLAERGLELSTEYSHTLPFSWRGLLDLSYAHRNFGYALGRHGERHAAIEQMRECLEIRRLMAAADTLGLRARFGVAEAYTLVGSAFADTGQMDSALVYHTRAMKEYERLRSLPRPPQWLGYELTYATLLTAEAYQALADTTQARWFFTRAVAFDGGGPTEPSVYLKRMRAVEEFAHFAQSIGDSKEAMRRHGQCFLNAREMMITLAIHEASPPAMADVVSALCHIADFMGPTNPPYVDQCSDLAEQMATRWLGPAHPLTVRSIAARAQGLARIGDRDGARKHYLVALALQPECVIVFRPQAEVIRDNIRFLSEGPYPPGSEVGVFFPRYHERTHESDWAHRLSLLTKRNRLWGQSEWPVVASLSSDPVYRASLGGIR